MIKFAEYVSPGHPDKVADYISSFLLDRFIEQDPDTRYAVEVQIKDHNVTLGGEVSSKCHFTPEEIAEHVRQAVREIGYTSQYARRWGEGNTLDADNLRVSSLISSQSPDIARGLDGWGDQGIFFGYANPDRGLCGMPYEHTMAKRLCKALFDGGFGGLDIKTQVVMEAEVEDNEIRKIIVAIPLLSDDADKNVMDYLKLVSPGVEIILNGTGRYVKHASCADCGTTGRKLAVDFYGGACRIGGGSPWTKDASKADLTLNLYARQLARKYADIYGCEIFVSLACSIGSRTVDYSVCDGSDNIFAEGIMDISPAELRHEYRLDTPIYASMCRWGLFGEFQTDKQWEKQL